MEQEQPIEEHHRKMMQALAEMLSDVLKPSGFALMVFDFKDAGRMNYISNASRPHMLEAMREFLARNDGTYVDPSNVFHLLTVIDAMCTGALSDFSEDEARDAFTQIRSYIKQAQVFHQ